MKSFIAKGLGSGGIVYAILNMVYGNAQYADFGITEVSTSTIQTWIPIIAAILYPVLSSKWPALASLLKAFIPQVSADESVLTQLNTIEIQAAKSGCQDSIDACCALRQATLNRLKNA